MDFNDLKEYKLTVVERWKYHQDDTVFRKINQWIHCLDVTKHLEENVETNYEGIAIFV